MLFRSRAADKLNLGSAVREVLRYPKREVTVNFPVQLDDGTSRVFTGYRVWHNLGRGPAKGGIRFHPQSDLEEIVLDVMERQEAAQGSRESSAAEREEIAATRDVVTARRDAALAEIAEQAGKAGDRRAAVASEEPQDLLDLYGRMREQHGGVGAAALRGGRCEGCHLSLNTVDLNNIRNADPDEVLRCEECRRILVRTPESGL